MDSKEIRFIDNNYNELFRIKDGEQITITKKDGKTMDCRCYYVDDTHTRIAGIVYHIAQFAEKMEEIGSIIRPTNAPSYLLENVDQSEFEFMYRLKNKEENRGCICIISGIFENSVDVLGKTMEFAENSENYSKYKTGDFTIEMLNIINYLRYQSDTPVLKSRTNMYEIAHNTKAEHYVLDPLITGFRITTNENTYYLRCDSRRGQSNLCMYCYNTRALDKYRNTRLVDQNLNKVDRDLFFKTDNGVKEVYYNPDSVAGGQFVINEISNELIKEAYSAFKYNSDEFFSCLNEKCNQYLVDIDSPNFRSCLDRFLIAKPDFENYNRNTMKGLAVHAGAIPEKKHNKQEPER